MLLFYIDTYDAITGCCIDGEYGFVPYEALYKMIRLVKPVISGFLYSLKFCCEYHNSDVKTRIAACLMKQKSFAVYLNKM